MVLIILESPVSNLKILQMEFTNKLNMPSYVYSHRPAFLYLAFVQLSSTNINIQTTHMTFSGTWVILPSGSQSTGTFLVSEWRLDPVLFFNALVYFIAFNAVALFCISLQMSVCFKRFPL